MTIMQSTTAITDPSLQRSNTHQSAYISVGHQNIQPRPSSPSSLIKRKLIKRKRDIPEPVAEIPQLKKNRDGPKKKKANRACFHCQKAHLTCDDSRPCQRCLKRGFANNCTEGHRKKAKYLLDEDELEELKRSKSVPKMNPPEPPQMQPEPEQFPPPNDPTLFNPPFDNLFSSENVTQEYYMLSAILGGPSPPDSPPQISSYGASWSPELGSAGFVPPYDALATTMPSFETSLSPNFINNYPSTSAYNSRAGQSPEIQYASQFDQPPPSSQEQPPSDAPVALLDPSSSKDVIMGNSLVTPPTSSASPTSTASFPLGVIDAPSTFLQVQSINDQVTLPYYYTESWHFLMKYVTSRFERNDILRIVRAVAIFRPSLIALQMSLTAEDEVFVERCFQRSLAELGKLISFIGTPTVVWRRTGEICLVAEEFYHLTDWTAGQLLGRKTYIYELFENQSVVEYWESFAGHAFENTTQSVYSHCVLLKPDGTPIPSTFCFSIRRDVFDLPSIVIGQWLPLL